MEQHLQWLGWEVTDRVSGFRGIVTSIGVDLYGCVQAIVSPRAIVDKASGSQKMDAAGWFDVSRLQRIGKAPVMKRIVPRDHDVPGGYDKPLR